MIKKLVISAIIIFAVSCFVLLLYGSKLAKHLGRPAILTSDLVVKENNMVKFTVVQTKKGVRISVRKVKS